MRAAVVSCGPAPPAAYSTDYQCSRSPAAAHAWCPAPGQHSRRCPARHHVCCQAKGQGDVGRLLRDALAQPSQGTNLAYLAAGNYLRSLSPEFENQAEVTRVLDIAMNPNSLYTTRNRKQPTNPHARKLDVETDLKAVVEFLLGAGLTQQQLVKAIQVHPPVLSYRVDSRLAPFFEYLNSELGLSQQEAAQVVERRPSILGVDVDGLRRMVAYLQENGNSREQIIELMSTSL